MWHNKGEQICKSLLLVFIGALWLQVANGVVFFSENKNILYISFFYVCFVLVYLDAISDSDSVDR